MAVASILSRVTLPVVKADVTDASRDDLALNDVVELESVNTGTAYQWSIAFKPEGSTAVFSSSGTESAIVKDPGTFTVDVEGPYLIRLAFTDGTGTTEQFVRLRALTDFGQLKLVAAGERYDAVPVPVDAQPDGWADEQNYNLNQLLDLVYGITPSTASRTLFVDPAGDDATGLPYQTIQAAMDYANSQAPTAATQWVVLVRPGAYVEDLTFYQWVNLFGWPGGEGTPLVTVQNATVASHSISLDPNATLALCNLKFERSGASANATISQAANGAVRLVRCRVEGWGSGGAYASSGDTTFIECRLAGEVGSGPADYAATLSGSATFDRCTVTGQSGIFLGVSSALVLRDTQINTVGTASIDAFSDFILRYCQVVGPIRGNPTGAGTPGDIQIDIKWSQVADVSLDGTAVIGTASLSLGSTSHGTLSTAGGATLAATAPADTVFYDNALFPVKYPLSPAPSLTAENVQDALDEIYNYASQVRTLDDAYDGGDPGPTGSGRTIVADAGAVQIVDATVPSDPIPADNSNGNLEVVGAVRVGAIGKPEIDLDPNRYGNSARIGLGYTAWPNEAPFGGTGLVIGNATGNPSFLNYNLRVATTPAEGGGKVGEVFIRGGDALSTFDGASVSLQAGSGLDAGGGDGGDIFVAPGGSVAGSQGRFYLASPSTATAASLTAAGAFAGPAPAGLLRLGTEFGAVEVTFAGGEDLVATLGLLNAEPQISATEAAGVITITTSSLGPNAEIYFLSADAGLDAALGGLAVSGGASFTPGTWPDLVSLEVSASNEITIGGDAANPLVYNATTGKLTVPGLIDPTGMVFDEAATPPTGANKGAIFVSDGGGGLTLNHLYYVDAAGTTTDLTLGGGGGGTLQDAYNGGNTIVTAAARDVDLTLSAAGGGFSVNGDGAVAFGNATEVASFRAYSETVLTLQSRDDSILWMQANDGADKTLTIKGTNAGGAGKVQVEADDEIQLLAPYVNLNNGVDNANVRVSSGDPNGVLTGTAGDLLLDVTGNLWISQGGTVWTSATAAAASPTVKQAFTFSSASPVVVTALGAGDVVVDVYVKVSTTFNGALPEVTVGTTATSDLFMQAGDSDLTSANTYQTTPMEEIGAATNLEISLTGMGGATQGTALLVALIHRA